MDQQTAKTSAAAIVAGLKKAGIDFVASLPDEKMLEVIRAVETDPDLVLPCDEPALDASRLSRL